MDKELLRFYPTDEAPLDNNFPRWMPDDGIYGPFIPTSLYRVKLALKLADCKPGDIVADLGCGDGRFCAAAIILFDASFAVGIDSDATVIRIAETIVDQLSVNKLVNLNPQKISFVTGDICDINIGGIARDPSITILVAFLFPEFSFDFRDLLLAHFNRGCKIVAITFDLANIPELTLIDNCDRMGENGIW
ncbi:hypothetical protein HK100_004314, partial [Physocladia obscura]